jgi:4-hydroxy-tetrahydrodipicolinate synthase
MTLTGLHVPLITPFDDAGEIARPALEALARDALTAGAAGLVALGTTAEPGSLSTAERRTVLDVVGGVCREHGAALVVGANSIEAVTQVGAMPGVTATLSLVPPFVRPGAAGVHVYFTGLAAAAAVPVVIYHVPYRTGQALSAGALRDLAGIAGVEGIKLAAGGIDAVTIDLLADPPPGFAVLGGDDAFVSPLLALGAHGAILASAHLATAAFAELITAWRAGDAVRARPAGHRLVPLSAALFAEPNPTVVKGVLHALGRIPTPAVRLPLLPADAGSVHTALRRLRQHREGGLSPR